MMKKQWLILVMACIMCVPFISCGITGDNSSSSGENTPNSSNNSVDSEYDLGSYDNENEEQWWDSSENSASKNEDTEVETRPY